MMAFYEKGLGFVASDYVMLDEEDDSTKRVAFWRTDPGASLLCCLPGEPFQARPSRL